MKNKRTLYAFITIGLILLSVSVGIYLKKKKVQEEISVAYLAVNSRFITDVDYYVPFETSPYAPDGVHVNIYIYIHIESTQAEL